MRCYHAFVFLAAAACGDNLKPAQADASQTIDTAPPIDMMIDSPAVTGAHTHYIIDKITVPATNPQATQLGFDLDGNGSVDNKLGNLMVQLAGQGFPIQATVDQAIDRGQALLLVDLQAESLTSGAGSFVTWKGANPMPPPCSSAADTVCRHHLAGTGTFDLASDTWMDSPLVGTVASSTLDAGPGDLTLAFPLFPGMPVSVTLLGARVHATTLADASIGASKVGGAISQSDINTKLLPAVAAGFAAIITRDCNMPNNPPKCGCTVGSTGATIISQFDTNHDCMVTATELQNNALIQLLLAPDVTIEGMPGVSFGVGFTAVKGTYTVPGE
jgi:hypothetical protein